MEIVILLLRLVAVIVGIGIVFITLISAIRTFVLPRSAPDQIVRSVFLLMRWLFNQRMRKSTTYEQRDEIMALYAPITLMILPVIWLIIVVFGYMCIFWGFHPILLHDTLLLSEFGLLTLGLVPVDSLFTASMVFGEATVGLLLTAILIAYLPTMYAAFSARETLVTMLEVRAGSPPAPVTLFERYLRIRGLSDLHNLWVEWEMWFAQLEETHTSLAALSFFRSQSPNRSWITAAGAVMDSAALAIAVIDIPDDYQAALTIRSGYLALRAIADFFGIPHNATPKPDDPISIFREEFDELCDELAAANVPLKADRDQAWRDFSGWRVNYDTVLISLAALTMAPYARWISDRSLRRQKTRLFISKHAKPNKSA